MNISNLENISRKIRLQCLEMTVSAKRGHLGGTFSCVDILVALYYGGILKFKSGDPSWNCRDRFILSKGHACLAIYAILLDLDFISKAKYDSYGHDGGLGGQLDITIPGIDWNTGSLGHSLGVGAGISLAAKLDGKDFRTYMIIGDAECDEGSIWEAIMFASDQQLNNLICIVDRNRISAVDYVEDNAFFKNLDKALPYFGWQYLEINGHNFTELITALEKTRESDQPVMVIANTIKGKGISFMENDPKWHHSVPSAKQLGEAKVELS